MRRRISAFILAAFFVSLLVACSTPAGRTAGEVIDDGTITTKIKSELLANNITKGLAVSVQTFEGAVTLTGAVDTPEQRKAAEDVARNVKGVKKVNNLIQLKKS